MKTCGTANKRAWMRWMSRSTMLRQYLYCCTSKASKLSTSAEKAGHALVLHAKGRGCVGRHVPLYLLYCCLFTTASLLHAGAEAAGHVLQAKGRGCGGRHVPLLRQGARRLLHARYTSAYVSIRRQTSVCVSIRQHVPLLRQGARRLLHARSM